jgi:hypothetical protein
VSGRWKFADPKADLASDKLPAAIASPTALRYWRKVADGVVASSIEASFGADKLAV